MRLPAIDLKPRRLKFFIPIRGYEVLPVAFQMQHEIVFYPNKAL